MAIPTDYPHGILPNPLVGKQREQMQKYDTRSTFDGEMSVRKKRNSSTVYFDVSFQLTRAKSSLFVLWLTKVDEGQEFKMQLYTEDGFNEHTCRWEVVPDDPRESDGIFTYSGTIYAEKLVQGWDGATEDDLDDYWDVLVDDGVNPLAIAVNENWPT